jgi:hypothetical protein
VSTSPPQPGSPATGDGTRSAAEPWTALLSGLVDDAAVFPPRADSVADAVRAHRTHRRAWYSDLMGPLVVRASDVPSVLSTARAGDDLVLGLVADTGLSGLVEAVSALHDQDDRASVITLEIPLPDGYRAAEATRALVDQLAFSVTSYIEVPRDGFEDALDVLADDGAERAKYRTGGATPEAFPDEQQLASFVSACTQRRVAFKLTAGLHHPLRNTSPEGLEQHGFVNVLAATARAVQGGTVPELVELLSMRSADSLIPFVLSVDGPVLAWTRRMFRSFGCCGVTDPVQDLVGLGILTPDRA